jgi:hypothetical protein
MSGILYWRVEVELGKGEEVLFKGPANLWQGFKKQKGKTIN